MPLVDFCNCMDPQAQPRSRQTPSQCRGVATARRVAPPPKSRRQPGSHGSGVTQTLSHLRHPHVDLLRQRGFTPNRSTQTPSVAHRCCPRSGKRSLATTGRKPVPPTTPFETLGGSARPTRHTSREGATARLLGPSPAATRESNRNQLHPRCLPPQGPLCRPTVPYSCRRSRLDTRSPLPQPRGRVPPQRWSSRCWLGLLRHLFDHRRPGLDEIRATLAQPRAAGGAP